MSHRHKRQPADTGDRFAKLKAMRAELAAEYSLPATDPRIGQAALVKLNQQNWERDVLIGKAVPASELQAYSDTIAVLLGPPSTPLTIHYVDGSDVCVVCRGPLPPKAERVPAAPEATPEPVNAEAPAPQQAAKAAPPAPPANVVALHKDIHAGAQHK